MKRLLIAVGLACVSCSSTSSSGLSTSDIQGHFRVEVTADPKDPNVYVSADLYQGDSLTNVELAPGDTITASSDKNPSIPLDYDSTLKIYSTLLDKQGTDWTTVTFALSRSNGTPATSRITLPVPVALTPATPAPSAAYDGGNGSLALAWSNKLDTAQVVYFSQPCGSASIGVTSQQKPDDGTLSIPVGELVTSAPDPGGTCITVILRRYITVGADPALHGGSDVLAHRDDYIDVTITP